jgi:hypothetical protein
VLENRVRPHPVILAVLMVTFVTAGMLAGLKPSPALAWPAGYSGGDTLYACNYETGLPACGSFNWTVSSDIDFTKVWQSGGGYTVVNSLVHQVKTNSSWPGYSGYMSGSVSTTMYSAGWFFGAIYGWNLNGSCIIPPWTFWGCDYGTLGWTFYGTGSAYADGSFAMGGGGWYSYSGTNEGGWFYWQY